MNWQQFLSGLGQVGTGLAPIVGTGAQMYGQQNAAEAVTNANQNAITNQQNYLGNINSIFQPQRDLGNNAFSTLGSTLGVNGQPANYSNFLNMPGYNFAVQQGTQALQRQAAAAGSAYTPNTAAAIGQYVTGTAMQDYNTYVNQLLSAGNFGAQANNTLGNITYNTGANTSQLMANIGQAQAGMYTGMGQTLNSGLNGSGVGGFAGGAGNIVGGIGNIIKGIGGMFNSSGTAPDPNNSGDMSGGVYNGGAFGGGAPLYDPTTGGYPGGGAPPGSDPNAPPPLLDANGNPTDVLDWAQSSPGP